MFMSVEEMKIGKVSKLFESQHYSALWLPRLSVDRGCPRFYSRVPSAKKLTLSLSYLELCNRSQCFRLLSLGPQLPTSSCPFTLHERLLILNLRLTGILSVKFFSIGYSRTDHILVLWSKVLLISLLIGRD